MKGSRYVEWSRLDNASKIFPATWSLKDPKVFRIACELTEEVDPQLLQGALDGTLEDIPVYKSVLRRGAFWYYFEKSSIPPIVELERVPVCAPIYLGHRDNLLFRVSYFNRRINLEVFHALSDGAGALLFLQTLVKRYLALAGKYSLEQAGVVVDSAPLSGLTDDSFRKHFLGDDRKKDKREPKTPRTYQLHGTRFPDNRMGLVEGAMSAQKVLEAAHRYDTTLTVFLASVFVYAIGKEMCAPDRKHPIVLNVPVNLRQYYESVTVRNFFGLVTVQCSLEQGCDELSTVIQSVKESFQASLTAERLDARANQHMAAERNLLARVVPLPIKDVVLRRFATGALRSTTSSISNIGKVHMPGELTPFIRQFSVCTSASRPQMTLCSYQDRLVVSITSPFRETELQRHFFRLLSNAQIEVELSSSFEREG